MLKLNASYSKKVPTKQKFSSESFLACVEVELPTGASAEELLKEIHSTFELVKDAVEAEISGKAAKGRSTDRPEAPEGRASQRQIKYLLDLAAARNRTMEQLNADIQTRFGVDSVFELSRSNCSRLLDELQCAA